MSYAISVLNVAMAIHTTTNDTVLMLLMPFCFWFAANVDSRKSVGNANIKKQRKIFFLQQHDFIAKYPTNILTMNQLKLHGNNTLIT